MNIVIATEGEYSDYKVLAILNWLSNTLPEQARDKWLEEHPDQKEVYRFNYDAFVSWLILQNYAEELDTEELHISSCSDVNDWERKKRRKHKEWIPK